MDMQEQAKPVGGPIMTRWFRVLLALTIVAGILLIWRFVAGLGATTSLNSGFPWGLWIAFDVVTGTALACGGYAMALLVYVFNNGKYHPLVRPAILTSALGYSLAAFAVAVDVGRPWALWKVPAMIWRWNVNSVLLEVAVCISAYVLVLWIEVAPAFLERWRTSGREGLRRFAEWSLPILNRALFTIVALGVILPTLHQSSLGSLMLLAGPKLHPAWNTPLLPMFFLLTSIAMGFAMVVFETVFSSFVLGRKSDRALLPDLQRIAAYLALIFVVARLVDLIARGRFDQLVQLDGYTLLFWAEMGLFLVPMAYLVLRSGRPRLSSLFREAVIMVIAGALYRFDTFILAFRPSPGWRYFPSVTEIAITVGMLTLQVAAYVILVKRFPILGGSATGERWAEEPALASAKTWVPQPANSSTT
jgi:Ni/Fe-hydrogenase subunit HybB-like protein